MRKLIRDCGRVTAMRKFHFDFRQNAAIFAATVATPQQQTRKPAKAAAQSAKPASAAAQKPVDPLAAPKILPGSPEAKAVAAMFGVHEFLQAVISPDGKQVAWVESLTGKNGAPSARFRDLCRRVEKSESGASHYGGSGGKFP